MTENAITCPTCSSKLGQREQIYNGISHLQLYCTGCDRHIRFLKSTTDETFVMPFGMHKGECMQNIPTSYLRWAVINLNNHKLQQKCSDELMRRGEEI